MSSPRKFNTMKDCVTVLRGEVSQFSFIIHSAQKSKPECQEIVKTYVETLKGLWSQVNQEIHEAEDFMVQVLRSAQVEERGGTQTDITINSVKEAHKKQADLANDVFILMDQLTVDSMVANNRIVAGQIDQFQVQYNQIAKDPAVSRAFTVLIAGTQKEIDFNKSVFQSYLSDLLLSMKSLSQCYQSLDLVLLRNTLEKNNSKEREIVIKNTVLNSLERNRISLDNATYKKAISHGMKVHPDSAGKLQLLGQKYYEYSTEVTRVADFAITLLHANGEPMKVELFKEMTRDLRNRSDSYFKQMDSQVIEWLRSVHCPTYYAGSPSVRPQSGPVNPAGPINNSGVDIRGAPGPSYSQSPYAPNPLLSQVPGSSPNGGPVSTSAINDRGITSPSNQFGNLPNPLVTGSGGFAATNVPYNASGSPDQGRVVSNGSPVGQSYAKQPSPGNSGATIPRV